MLPKQERRRGSGSSQEMWEERLHSYKRKEFGDLGRHPSGRLAAR